MRSNVSGSNPINPKGHAYGLLQHGFVREFLLCAYALSAHQYTRGSWTAPETRLVDPATDSIGYAVPAQLVIPMLLRWMLVFEDPDETLHLAKGVPRAWLADGERIVVRGAPTRWGAVDVDIRSSLATGTVRVEIHRPAAAPVTALHLRLPEGVDIADVVDDSGAPVEWSAAEESVRIPAGAEQLALTVHVNGGRSLPTA